ncbi:MAG: c-type cytochrome [Oceanisphaera sp.]|nr:c-type cytochrome [Oceanisphaera sp.]
MNNTSRAKSRRPWAIAVVILAPLAMVASHFLLNDSSAEAEQLRLGKLAYQDNCAGCHGADLNGSRKGPPFIHKVYEPAHHGDEAFYRAVANGVRAHHWRFGDMPPVTGVSRNEVSDIIAYIREQQRQQGIH